MSEQDSQDVRKDTAQSTTPERAEADLAPAEPGPEWEKYLDSYPTAPEGDPRWAIVVFWIWMVFATLSIVFMAVLLVLGIWYD